MLVSQQQEAAPASLHHFLLSDWFPPPAYVSNLLAWVCLHGLYALMCVGKRGGFAIHFLAWFPAPTVEAVF